MDKLERRFLLDQENDYSLRVERRGKDGDPVIHGTAIVFNSLSKNLGGFHETIRSDAFDNFFKENRSSDGGPPDIAALFNHDVGCVLGRTPDTLKLTKDERGIHFELKPPKSSQGIVESVERRDIRGASFAFVCAEDGESWSKDEEGRSVRTISNIDQFFEISLVLQPAYEETSLMVAKRSLQKFEKDFKAMKKKVSNSIDKYKSFLETRQNPDDAGFRIGDKVFFDHEGASVAGTVKSLLPNGLTGNPLDEFNLLGIPNGPAAVVSLYRQEDGEWVATGIDMVKKQSLLTSIRDPEPMTTKVG